VDDDGSFFMYFEDDGGHPEGTCVELTSFDDQVWNLRTYLECLKNWDVMNECIEQATKDYTRNYGSDKLGLRLSGLELLRDVDSCG
jgi:hypothetical protein